VRYGRPSITGDDDNQGSSFVASTAITPYFQFVYTYRRLSNIFLSTGQEY